MISVIIVHYKVQKELINCILSILKSKNKVKFEIIVIDNDQDSKIGKDLAEKFPKVKYIKTPKNIGFGAGNNLGARCATGEYLFFLNPDTEILDRTLDSLYNFFIKNKNAGVISPLLLDKNLTPFKSQGSKELTPKTIISSQSFLRNIFVNNNIYNDNIMNRWDTKSPLITETVPGAAMMIRADVFKQIKGFDENIFLYFEENDISKRIAGLGYKQYIVPSAKIVHLVGMSTKHLKNMEDVYAESRYYYLKKHYGLLKSIFTQAILSINKTSVLLLLILISGLFLRIADIDKTMQFIGDQGWFYLSARDILIKGVIPLVGIASSHPWLHQGPLWTYLLAFALWLFKFNPVGGAYLTLILEAVTIISIYILGKEMFSKKIGIISALLYSASPLAVLYSRTPYHTSPIPLFTLLYFYSLLKFVKGNNIYFPLTIFFLAILYNFELATVILWFVLLAVLAYGMCKKEIWIKKIFGKKILIFSLTAFLIPMFPVLLYDINHDFPQTLGFAAWMGYRILRFFGFPSISGTNGSGNFNSIFNYFLNFHQNLIFVSNSSIAGLILAVCLGLLAVTVYNYSKKKVFDSGFTILLLWLLISFAGYFVNTSSEAYFPILFPAVIYQTAFSMDLIMAKKFFIIPVILLIIFIVSANSYSILLSDYSSKGLTYSKRLSLVRKIIKIADGRDYNIVGVGPGSQFESFTMNYEYLAWWLGHGPAQSPQKLRFLIREGTGGVYINSIQSRD